jgi:uncharacterized membrane-anchored protein
MRIKFIILILIQVFLLAGIILYRQYWVATGERIILVTEPVDPRDLFRGDYVRLNYEISTLDLNMLGAKERFKRRDRVYVLLEKSEDNIYRASSVSKGRPEGQIFIQGIVKNVSTNAQRWEYNLIDDSGATHILRAGWFDARKGDRLTCCLDARNHVIHSHKEDASSRPACPTGRSVTGIVEDIKIQKISQLNVAYGIESYFVEEGKGKEIEASRDRKNLKVEVCLRKDGQGMITALALGKIVIQ